MQLLCYLGACRGCRKPTAVIGFHRVPLTHNSLEHCLLHRCLAVIRGVVSFNTGLCMKLQHVWVWGYSKDKNQ